MANVTKWSNVSIAMQSAIASSNTIEGITKADPGVITITAHGYSDGDYLLLSVTGMVELDGRVVRVSNGTANTFEIEGVDTTLFGTFATGTAQKLTLGTTLATVTGVSSSGGEYDFIDTTTVHDSIRKQIPGLPSALAYTFENIWDAADAALIAMKAASDTQSQKAFLFTFANGQKMAFYGYVGASLVPGGSAQDKVTTSATISASGSPTYYSS